MARPLESRPFQPVASCWLVDVDQSVPDGRTITFGGAIDPLRSARPGHRTWSWAGVLALGAGLLLACAGPPQAQAEVLLGSDVLAKHQFRELKGKRVGLLTNPSGVNRNGTWTVDTLRAAPGVRLVALFGPEHGLYGRVRAGERVEGGVDKRTGLPVHSLYGATRKPTPQMLEGLDVLVYDLQDTGTRSYTYISTLGLAMEACAEADIEFVVLDRPNPLGGIRVEGPMLEDRFRSFIGRWDIPYVYGLTPGELALMINGEGWISRRCRLQVVPLEGWHRAMTWRDTGLRWVATSPNIPDSHAVFGYPALGILGEISGGSGLSIGGVVKRPFQCVTATWLDADALAAELSRAKLPGLSFQPFTLEQEGRTWRCVNLAVKDPVRAPLVAVNFHVLEAVRKVAGRDLLAEAERSGRSFELFDKAVGSDSVRQALRAGRSAAELVRSWRPGEEAFRQLRWKYLLYKTDGPAQSVSHKEVKVSRGDTLYGIARREGVPLEDVLAANQEVDPTRLRVGQLIRVPRR
jgi:uncharacterized protein YbbC (DUF1343 family)